MYGSRRILRRDHVSEASSRLAKDLVTLTKLQSHTSAPGEQVRLYSVCRRHVGQRRRHSSCSQCSGRNDTIKRRDSTQQHTCTRTVLGFRPTAIHRVKSRYDLHFVAKCVELRDEDLSRCLNYIQSVGFRKCLYDRRQSVFQQYHSEKKHIGLRVLPTRWR